MRRKDALDAIMEAVSNDDAIISSTGLISRQLYQDHDSEQQFYMPGSMGLASSIGLGIAINKPKRRVIVIDGDASLLLNLGSLVTIGYLAPLNLVHIVLDNNAYGSCSEEPTTSETAKLDEIARTVGYRNVCKVDSEEGLKNAIKSSYDHGPYFILTEIGLGGKRHLARPLELESIKHRFMDFLNKTRTNKNN